MTVLMSDVKISFACLFSYVLGAVETFLNAVPSAGLFKGNHGHCLC